MQRLPSILFHYQHNNT